MKLKLKPKAKVKCRRRRLNLIISFVALAALALPSNLGLPAYKSKLLSRSAALILRSTNSGGLGNELSLRASSFCPSTSSPDSPGADLQPQSRPLDQLELTSRPAGRKCERPTNKSRRSLHDTKPHWRRNPIAAASWPFCTLISWRTQSISGLRQTTAHERFNSPSWLAGKTARKLTHLDGRS